MVPAADAEALRQAPLQVNATPAVVVGVRLFLASNAQY